VKLPHLSRRTRVLLRLGVFAVMLVLFGLALRGRWHGMADSVEKLSWWSLSLAVIFGFGQIITSMLSWRALLHDLGSPLSLRSDARIFYLGQLGKYLPGSVWTVVVQADLARDHHISARRTVAASVVSMGISLGAGLSIAVFTLPYASPGAVVHYWWVLLLLPLIIVCMLPRSVDFLTHLALKVLRREPPDHEFTWRGVSRASWWQLIGWGLIGMQTYVLCLALHAPVARTLLLAIGGTALAWSAGFVAVPIPAGAGVREAVLVAVLSPVLKPGPALVVALVSRAVATVGDGVFAGAAFLANRGRRPQHVPEAPADVAAAAGRPARFGS
jgi:uncharacterized membrane protein YbhN (UPF0104 family)